jgi:hypothetical protein
MLLQMQGGGVCGSSSCVLVVLPYTMLVLHSPKLLLVHMSASTLQPKVHQAGGASSKQGLWVGRVGNDKQRGKQCWQVCWKLWIVYRLPALAVALGPTLFDTHYLTHSRQDPVL